MKHSLILLFFIPIMVFAQIEDWQIMGEMPIPVSGADAVTIDTTIYILGGYSDSLKSEIKTIQAYYPISNTWSTVGVMNEARSGLFAGLHNNSILVYGGITEPDSNSKSLGYFQPLQSNSFTLFDSVFTLNRLFSSCLIYGNSLYIIGGYPITWNLNMIDTSYIIEYDLQNKDVIFKSQGLHNVGSFPSEHMSVPYYDDIYIFGGVYTGVSSRVFKFSISDSTHSRVSYDLPSPRAGGKAVQYQQFNIFLIGGYNETEAALSTVEYIKLEGSSMSFNSAASLNIGRKNLMTALFNDQIYVFGGKDNRDSVVKYFEKTSIYPITTIVENSHPVSEFRLYQNYPNPFNSSTKISFNHDNSAPMSLVVYSVLGEKIKTLVNNEFISGEKSILWNATDDSGNSVPGGIYIYRITSAGNSISKKMILLK